MTASHTASNWLTHCSNDTDPAPSSSPQPATDTTAALVASTGEGVLVPGSRRRLQQRADILDLVAHRSVFAYRRALAAGGRYRCVGGSVRSLVRIVTIGNLAARLTRRRMGMLVVKPGPLHFQPMTDLCTAGDVIIHIDRTFGLDDVPAALAHVGEGRALGKVVVTVS